MSIPVLRALFRHPSAPVRSPTSWTSRCRAPVSSRSTYRSAVPKAPAASVRHCANAAGNSAADRTTLVPRPPPPGDSFPRHRRGLRGQEFGHLPLRGGSGGPRQDRHFLFLGQPPGAALVAEQLQRLRGRTDENDLRLPAGAREIGVLRKESVARMDRRRAGFRGRGQDRVDIEIRGRADAGQHHEFVAPRAGRRPRHARATPPYRRRATAPPGISVSRSRRDWRPGLSPAVRSSVPASRSCPLSPGLGSDATSPPCPVPPVDARGRAPATSGWVPRHPRLSPRRGP